MVLPASLGHCVKRNRTNAPSFGFGPLLFLSVLHLGLFLQRLVRRVHCAFESGLKAGRRFLLSEFIFSFLRHESIRSWHLGIVA